MVAAELITPKTMRVWRRKGFLNSNEGIFCESCGLDYLDHEYEILFEHKKVAYFFFSNEDEHNLLRLVCHDCLFNQVKKIAKGKEFELVILDDKTEYICKFYPKETYNDEDQDK
jgi:hypothetical protein